MNNKEIFFYGKNVFEEIIKSNRFKIKNIYTSENNKKYFDKIPKNINLKFVSKDKLHQLTNSTNHQNIVIQVESYPYKNFSELNFKQIENSDTIFIALDSVQDPHNFGAVLRNCYCFGINNIIIQERNSVSVTPIVMKSSAGAAAHLNIYTVNNLNKIIDKFKENFIKIYSLDLSGKESIDKFQLELPALFIIGGEDRGVRFNLLKKSDSIIKIQLSNKFNSLNLSSASAVMLYEICKRKKM